MRFFVTGPILIPPPLRVGLDWETSKSEPTQIYTPQDVDTIVEVLRLDSQKAEGREPSEDRIQAAAEALSRAFGEKLDEMIWDALFGEQRPA